MWPSQPFVLSQGDPSGFGSTGGFQNGWDAPDLQVSVAYPGCLCLSTSRAAGPDLVDTRSRPSTLVYAYPFTLHSELR